MLGPGAREPLLASARSWPRRDGGACRARRPAAAACTSDVAEAGCTTARCREPGPSDLLRRGALGADDGRPDDHGEKGMPDRLDATRLAARVAVAGSSRSRSPRRCWGRAPRRAGYWMRSSCINPDGTPASSEGWSGFSNGVTFGSTNSVACGPGISMFALLSADVRGSGRRASDARLHAAGRLDAQRRRPRRGPARRRRRLQRVGRRRGLHAVLRLRRLERRHAMRVGLDALRERHATTTSARSAAGQPRRLLYVSASCGGEPGRRRATTAAAMAPGRACACPTRTCCSQRLRPTATRLPRQPAVARGARDGEPVVRDDGRRRARASTR